MTIVALMVLAVTATNAMAQGTGRPVAVRDIIETAELAGSYGSTLDAAYSKNRNRFVFAVQRADIQHNTVVGAILLFRLSELFDHPKPDTVATFTSTSNEPPIADLHWLGDTAVILRGEQPDKPTQVYVVNVATRAVRALTKSPTPVTRFGLAPNQRRFAYMAEAVVDSMVWKRRNTEGFVVTQSLGELAEHRWANEGEWDLAQTLTVVSLTDGREAVVKGLKLIHCSDGPTITPDNRHALLGCYYYSVIPSEMAYFESWARKDGRPMGYRVIVDLDGGTAFRLFDAPAWGQSETWSPDGNAMLLANAFLPASVLEPADRAAGRTPKGAFVLDVATRKLTMVSRRESLRTVRWDSSGTIVLRSTAPDSDELSFRRSGTTWSLATTTKVHDASAPLASPSPLSSDPQIVVDQELNTPRRVVAVQGGKRAEFFDPNPQYAALALAHAEVIQWHSADGDWEGGLYYPPGYTPGKRYPLVVQTHGFDKSSFEIEGYNSHTGYAAQALAAQGVMVLQCGLQLTGFVMFGSPDEAAIDARGMEAAIDTLIARGLVDRSKIALQGWSRSTYGLRYFLTHMKTPIVAALISDGVDYSYLQWLSHHLVGKTNYEAQNGGVIPIGDGLKAWQERSPTLQADKITAALRTEAINIEGSPIPGELFMWELHALLRRLGKPSEMIYYPNSEHEIVHPRQRLTSQGGAVDWFLFWLTGKEDPDPAKAEQYQRWRAMKR